MRLIEIKSYLDRYCQAYIQIFQFKVFRFFTQRTSISLLQDYHVKMNMSLSYASQNVTIDSTWLPIATSFLCFHTLMFIMPLV